MHSNSDSLASPKKKEEEHSFIEERGSSEILFVRHKINLKFS